MYWKLWQNTTRAKFFCYSILKLIWIYLVLKPSKSNSSLILEVYKKASSFLSHRRRRIKEFMQNIIFSCFIIAVMIWYSRRASAGPYTKAIFQICSKKEMFRKSCSKWTLQINVFPLYGRLLVALLKELKDTTHYRKQFSALYNMLLKTLNNFLKHICKWVQFY